MYDDLDPAGCRERLDQGWAWLDVRTPDEFAGGHPPGAVNVPWALLGPGGLMPNPAFYQVVAAVFGRERGLVVGCSDGSRSARACQMLGQMGFASLARAVGGFSGAHDGSGQVVAPGWAGSGLPVAAGADEGAYDAVFARLKR